MRPRLWVVASVAIALSVLSRLPVLLEPRAIDDETVYAVAGAELAAGGAIYESAIERKPPLLLWLYGAVAWVAGPYNALGLHLFATLWVVLTTAAVFATARRMFGDAAGLSGAALYVLYQQWGDWHSLAFNGEVLMNLPLACACAVAFGARGARFRAAMFVTGILCGIAFMLKQPGALATLPFAWCAVARQRRAADGLVVFAGAAVPVLAVAAWLWRDGLLADGWYWTIGDHDVPHVFWRHGVESTLLFVLVCSPLLALAAWSAFGSRFWSQHNLERQALIGLTVVSTVGAFASARFYAHYYIAIVLPLSLLAAPALASLLSEHASQTMRRGGRTIVVVYAATAVVFFALHWRGLAAVPDDTDAGSFLRTHTRPDDRIFVWGRGTRIYLDAQRRPASRFIATFPLTGRIFGSPPLDVDTRERVMPGAWDTLMSDFRAHPAEYIVDMEIGASAQYPASEFPQLASLLATDYELVHEVAEGALYRRRAPALIRTDQERRPGEVPEVGIEPTRAVKPTGF